MKSYQKIIASLLFAGITTFCQASENPKTNLEKKLEVPQRLVRINQSQIFCDENNKITYANNHPVIYDKQGKINYFNGNPVIYDSEGNIRYFNGHPIIREDNKITHFNGYPVIYDEKGEVTYFNGLPVSYIKHQATSDKSINYNLIDKQTSLMLLSLMPKKEQLDNKKTAEQAGSVIITESNLLPKLLLIRAIDEFFD